jgi:CRP-like cAMP-binding protein
MPNRQFFYRPVIDGKEERIHLKCITTIMNEMLPLRKYIQKTVPLDPAEEDLFVSKFKIKKIVKRQFIVQPGFVAEHRNFVLQGALRTYVVGDEGQDHTITFAIDEWWITDYPSYIFQKPATMFVVALEDSTLLQIAFKDEQFLKAANPKFETFFRKMAERSTAYMQMRIVSNLTQDAEERYQEFLDKYPMIVQKVPQYALASYLGMTTEFLSKIRNKKATRKS